MLRTLVIVTFLAFGFWNYRKLIPGVGDTVLQPDVDRENISDNDFFLTSKYFTQNEFDSPDLPGSGVYMQVDFLRRLEDARTLAGEAFSINSGYRTPERNTEKDGSPTSSHMLGYAADIHCWDFEDMKRKSNACYRAGFRRIGLYYTKLGNYFIHVDNDPSKSPAIWSYHTGKKQEKNFFHPKDVIV